MNPLTVIVGFAGTLLAALLIKITIDHNRLQGLQQENLRLDNEIKRIVLKKEKGE